MPFSDRDKPCIRYSRTVVCFDCNRHFPDSQSLVQHLKGSSAHNEEQGLCGLNQCSICHQSFSTKYSLIQHLQQKPSHRRDLHLAVCIGNAPFAVPFMRTQYANRTGCSHKCRSNETGKQIGFTPMHCAAFGGHKDCLKVMLNWDDGDPNVKDPTDGRTPVHIAAWKGNADCLQILLHHGGDPVLIDWEGETALDLATPACKRVIDRHLDYENLRRRASKIFQHLVDFQHHARTVLPVGQPAASYLSHVTGFLRQASADLADSTSRLSLVMEETCTGSELALSTAEPAPSPTLPYEVLARGPVAVEAFNRALSEGEAYVSRMQLAVIGDVGAGKTSLVRTLSGEQFEEERHETHGIDRSMVEMTELDSSWNLVDLDKSHLDDILADVVSKDIKSSKVLHGDSSNLSQSQDIIPYTPPDGAAAEVPSHVAVQNLNPFTFIRPHDEGDDQGIGEDASDCTSMVLASGEKGEQRESPREMPVKKIAENLSRETSNEKETKLYAKISIWDFAGHPLYETMHHIFLNSRSFYLVVFSLAKFKDNEDETLKTLRFWLNSVRVHTPRSTPMFMVGTHCDEVQDEVVLRAEKVTHDAFDEGFGQQLIPSKEKCFLFAVDNSRGSEDVGAVALKKMIEKEAHRLEHVEEKLPIRWLHIEEVILGHQATDTPRCMPKENFREMIDVKSDAMSYLEFDSMLQFFHDSGVIILPEALIGPSAQDHLKLVVLDPQYLVDVMTRLHDIENQIQENRQFRSHWSTLKNEGLATMELLELVWKDFETPAKDLVRILQAAGLLCPVHVQVPAPEDAGATQLEKPPNGSSHIQRNGDSTDTGPETASSVHKFVVPFHLARKDLQGKWRKSCRRWKGICATDKVLIFDFQNFLPPALFNYLLVRTTAESERTNGMQPIMAHDMGIFSFGDRFFLLLRRIEEYNQIQVNIRHRHEKKLHEALETLNSIMTGICDQYFKYLKITVGPPCPSPSCPGASEEGKVLKQDSSSEDSEEGEEEEEEAGCGGHASSDDGSRRKEQRQHVISIDPYCPGVPLWCNTVPLHEFEEIMTWFSDGAAGGSIALTEEHMCARRVEGCCLTLVSKEVSSDWKWLGRSLKVEEPIVENIEVENAGNQQEQAYQVQYKWMKTEGDAATVKRLVEALTACKRLDIVVILRDHYSREHME